MCWKSNKEPIKQIADEDIHVYKFVIRNYDFDNNIFFAYYQKYKYIVNKKNEEIDLSISHKDNGKFEINRGYHSYSPDVKIITRIHGWIINNLSYCFLAHDGYLCVAECLIPKGSIYYKNEDGEIVSSNITLTDNIVNISYSVKRFMTFKPCYKIKDFFFLT